MKRKIYSKVLAAALAVSVTVSSGFMPGTEVLQTEAAATGQSNSAVSSQEFKETSMQYRPGVRWWWPGGAVEEDELQSEINYLAENGFGYVEINPFGKVEAVNNDEAKIKSVYTPEFYELLDKAISMAEEKGITVDLNMGSGWNANSQNVTIEDSMGNMALGRLNTTGSSLFADTSVKIPEMEQSLFYTEANAKGTLDTSKSVLQGVLIGELTGEQGMEFVPGSSFLGPTPAYNEFKTDDGTTKTYTNQLELNLENSFFIDAQDGMIQNGEITLSTEIKSKLNGDKNYEVISLYSLPSGGKAIDCANDWFTVDHMDSEKVTSYINEWLGESALNQILQNHSNIRAAFNDSYEFYSDMYYTEDLYDLAKDSDSNGLGYDFTKYLPTVYKQYSAAPFYMGLGTKGSFLTYSLDDSEKSRITYDYNTLVNQKFQEGMKAFQTSLSSYGLLYRQEAYNPPIDTIGSAQYVDIPEAEQANEFSLIRVSSGAHLYGKNLVTCEQYTLGCAPFKNTLELVKVGYDIMATSGVNNFFYHGFNYHYGVGSEEYGEEGWSPMPTTGINITESNTLSPYFEDMNGYAARLNYLMQQGNPSKDAALYMPFNGSLSETDAVKAMNYNGYTWDAINDSSIVSADTQCVDGKISVNGGTMVYDELIVESSSLPVETITKLSELAAQGAKIIFCGSVPSAQPGFSDGDYAAQDKIVADTASAMVNHNTAVLASSIDELGAVLRNASSPEVSYETNTNVRFTRRTLADGGELVYIRNIGAEENEITLNINGNYKNFYWMDVNTGEIYDAQKNADNTITIKMQAGTDVYSSTRSMAIALLCEPEGVGFAQSELTLGEPDCLDTTIPQTSEEVVFDSLTITADNIGGTIGESQTVTYTDQILGKWNSADFQNGQLQKVASDGVYKASYTVNKDMTGQKAVLNLGNVYTAATVSVSGKEAGKVMYAPYTIDITDYLQTGENTIEVTVTPRKYNRHYDALVDTGLEGPVKVEYTQKELTELKITKNPEKTTYTAGEELNLKGMEVTAVYQDGTTAVIKDYTVSGYQKDNTGTQTITISYGGKALTFTVSVNAKAVPVTKLTLNTSSKTLAIGKTLQLTAKILPDNASNKKVTYSTSDSKVAAVDANTGKVTAKSAGKTIVKAAAADGSGQTAQCVVIVKPDKVTSFKVKTQTTNSIELKWSKVSKADGYTISRYDSNKKKYAAVASVKGSTCSYQVSRLNGKSGSRLSAGLIYRFKIQAYKVIDGKKVYSDSVTQRAATKPAAPVITKVTQNSSKAAIVWKKQAKASGYEIWMSTKKGSGYKKIKTITSAKKTSYRKTGLNKNKNYYFKVRSYRTVNHKKVYSSFSTIKK